MKKGVIMASSGARVGLGGDGGVGSIKGAAKQNPSLMTLQVVDEDMKTYDPAFLTNPDPIVQVLSPAPLGSDSNKF
jgi:hypothetical protein